MTRIKLENHQLMDTVYCLDPPSSSQNWYTCFDRAVWLSLLRRILKQLEVDKKKPVVDGLLHSLQDNFVILNRSVWRF